MNEMTERAFYTSDTRPIVQCGLVPGEVQKDESIKYEDVSECLCGGRLTVQVNATLHFSGHNWMRSEEEQISGAGLALRRGLKTLFDDNLFVDVTFKCADREFRAHKGVLASQSAVFKQMFATRRSSGLIKISGTDPEVISEMLQYLYTGSAPNIETVAKDLLIVTKRYELLQLLAMCEKELGSNLSASNAVELLVFADLNSALHLRKECLTYIHRHPAEVKGTNQWKELAVPLKVEAADFRP